MALIKCEECGKEISDGEAIHNKGLCKEHLYESIQNY